MTYNLKQGEYITSTSLTNMQVGHITNIFFLFCLPLKSYPLYEEQNFFIKGGRSSSVLIVTSMLQVTFETCEVYHNLMSETTYKRNSIIHFPFINTL